MANLDELGAETPLNFLKAGESGRGTSAPSMPAAKPTTTGSVIFELTGAQISNELQQMVPIVPGQCYRFEFRVKGVSDGGGLVAELAYLNAGGGTLATYSTTANPSSLDADAWVTYQLMTAPSPTTATQARLKFTVQGRSKSLQLADVALVVGEQPR